VGGAAVLVVWLGTEARSRRSSDGARMGGHDRLAVPEHLAG
jgi:hypothetical protein